MSTKKSKRKFLEKNKLLLYIIFLLVIICALMIVMYFSNDDKTEGIKKFYNNSGEEVIEIPPEYINLMCKPNTTYTSKQKKWNDFEWLKLMPEYPEKNKLIAYEVVDGSFIKIYYKNVDYNKLKKWINSLEKYDFKKNQENEKTDKYIAFKRRNFKEEVKVYPYYFYDDKSLTIFVNNTEYNKDVQDAEWYFSQYKGELPCTPTHKLGKLRYNSDEIIEYIH